MRKISILLTAGIFLLIIFIGCRQKAIYHRPVRQDENYQPHYIENVVVDDYHVTGTNRQYFQAAPQRAVVVGETLLETFVALGIDDSILLAAGYEGTSFRPEAQYAARYAKLSVQRGLRLNKEMVLAMCPDFIAGGQVVFTADALSSTEFWNERNINTYCSVNANSPTSSRQRETLEGEYAFVLGLGKIYGREELAGGLVADMERDLQQLQQATQGRRRPRVLIVEDLGGTLVSYGRNKLAGDICSRLHGIVEESDATIGLEDILRIDPDVLFAVTSDGEPEQAAEHFRQLPALRHCRCVKNNQVYGIALSYTYNSAIKTGAGIRRLAVGMYPDLIKELDKRDL